MQSSFERKRPTFCGRRSSRAKHGLDLPSGRQAGRVCAFRDSYACPVVTAVGRWRRLLVGGVAASTIASGCYHWAEVTTTWAGRGRSPVSFQHVVAVFATSNEPLRHRMEARLASQFPNGAASYGALGATGLGDVAAVRRVLDRDRFDSAIIMTVVQADPLPVSLIAVVPKTRHPFPAETFIEQWDRVWNPPFDPALVPDKRLVAIELQLYSLSDDRLIWAGRGDAGDAKSLLKLGDAAVRNLTRELAREGLIAANFGAEPPHVVME